jgi:hypothetical protein
VTAHAPAQVTSRCSLPAPNSLSAVSSTQVRSFFEHYLALRSQLTCQNEFRDTFSDSPVPKANQQLSRLVIRFRNAGNVQKRKRPGRASVLSDHTKRDIHISNTLYDFLFFNFNMIYFLIHRTWQQWVARLSDRPAPRKRYHTRRNGSQTT